jgi:hypothetical protein
MFLLELSAGVHWIMGLLNLDFLYKCTHHMLTGPFCIPKPPCQPLSPLSVTASLTRCWHPSSKPFLTLVGECSKGISGFWVTVSPGNKLLPPIFMSMDPLAHLVVVSSIGHHTWLPVLTHSDTTMASTVCILLFCQALTLPHLFYFQVSSASRLLSFALLMGNPG